MLLLENLRAARQRAWAERKTLTWAGLALLSRLAPLSAVPLMLHFSTFKDADQYALILANAAITSIVINFGQVTNMQSRFSGSGFSSIAFQGLFTALLISLIIALGAELIFRNSITVVINVAFALSMALTAQYNTLLRCANNFKSAVWSEVIRITVFAFAIYFLVTVGGFNYISMALVMIVYYAIPYVVIVSGSRLSLEGMRAAIGETWIDRRRLFYWTLSASLSAGAWVAIRYAVAIFGNEGDLAKFSAVMSVCSAGVIMTDLLFVRISRMIISHAEGGRMMEIIRLMKVMGSFALLGFIFLVFISISYIYFALEAQVSVIMLSILLSMGYLLRFFYVFGQNIMIARGIATYDLLGGIAMMIVATAVSVLSVPTFGIVGAGAAFLSTALVMLLVIARGVQKHWGEV